MALKIQTTDDWAKPKIKLKATTIKTKNNKQQKTTKKQKTKKQKTKNKQLKNKKQKTKNKKQTKNKQKTKRWEPKGFLPVITDRLLSVF